MVRIQENEVIGDTGVILGQTSGPDELVFVDLESHAVSRALAYNSRILGGRWLVSTEYYPSHLFPPQYPNDVLLVRDLTATNHERVSPVPSDLEGMIREAGTPVFPERNATSCSYRNVQESDDTIRVFSTTSVLLDQSRLAFVATHGKEGVPGKPYLVLLNIDGPCGRRGEVRTRDLGDVSQRLDLSKTESLQVERLEAAENGSVRLIFPRGTYSISEMIVALP